MPQVFALPNRLQNQASQLGTTNRENFRASKSFFRGSSRFVLSLTKDTYAAGVSFSGKVICSARLRNAERGLLDSQTYVRRFVFDRSTIMKVLLATEGSEFSKAAIEKCCQMFAESDNTEIRIISAAEPTIPPAEPFAVSAEYISQIDAAARKQATEVVSQAEAEIRSRFPTLANDLTTTVVTGSPAQAVVEEAENWGADLIVTGSHGHGFWKRAWLGSVSNAIVHHAPCSVLVVRKDGPIKV